MNLPDGRVELYVEGPENEVDLFLAEIEHQMSGYIKDTSVQDLPPTGKYKRFTIRYY